MATATIVKHWKDATNAYLAAAVQETGGLVEYIGESALVDGNGNAYSAAQLKANCLADLAAKRNAQLATVTTIAATGTVTV